MDRKSTRRRAAFAPALVIAVIAICGCDQIAVSAVRAAFDRSPARLSAANIDDIATLLKLEDTRNFDEAELGRIVKSSHPEVRRRAVMTMGRIVNDKAKPMLAALRADSNPEILATVAWATGQQKDAGAVPWLGQILNAKGTPVAVAKEAAQALGKIRSPEARTALAAYLSTAPMNAAPTVVGEALLSIGRFTTKEDIAPIVRWVKAADSEIRWRAAWALFRPRDPLATPHLMTLSIDASPEVRFWAVRGLTAPVVGQSAVTPADASARLRQAMNDPDRRVRTEALRALVGYDDDASIASVLKALESNDTWLSVSAADPSLNRLTARAAEVAPALIAAGDAKRPLALRISALAPLVTLAPDAARALAASLANENSTTAKNAAASALRQLDNAARGGGAGRAGGGGRGQATPPPAIVARPDAEYRALVTKWIVPDYNGKKKPRVAIDTPRGTVEIELYPGDAPFGVEYLFDVIAQGDIVGTEFGRVVPNFVAQENAIRPSGRLRDEVNRRGLTRGNLSWASAGLDTGRPGYTLGSTPQPHNEGDFTSLGRVVKGLDVVDRIELGDKITGARIIK